MNPHRGLACAGLLLCLLTPNLTLARNPEAAKNTRVTVQVAGYDPVLIERVSAYLKNELRNLKGITLATDEPGLYLRIMVIENKNRFETSGYTLSVLASSTIEPNYLRTLVPDDARRAFLMGLYRTAEKLSDQWIVSTTPADLEDACRKIAATFYQGAYQQAINERLTVGQAVFAAGN